MTDVVVDSAAEKPTDEASQVEEKVEAELPLLSPRQQAMNEIVSQTEGLHEADNVRFRETVQEVDEEGKPIQPREAAPVEETPPESGEVPPVPESGHSAAQATPAFDPAQEYELVVDGHKVMVRGEKIIEMGKRSLQKEAAADLRLSLASRILEEAKQRSQQMTAPQEHRQEVPPQEEVFDEVKLAEAIQFGSKEDAAAAIKKLSSKQGSQVTPEQVMGFVRKQLSGMVAGELEFNDAAKFVSTEYKDLMDNPRLKQLFFIEEQKLRQEGDRRSYKELYKAIGDDLRSAFNLKPPAQPSPTPTAQTMEQRKQEKARSTPPVPRTAAARLDTPAAPKAPSHLDILNQMRAARKQPQLNG